MLLMLPHWVFKMCNDTCHITFRESIRCNCVEVTVMSLSFCQSGANPANLVQVLLSVAVYRNMWIAPKCLHQEAAEDIHLMLISFLHPASLAVVTERRRRAQVAWGSSWWQIGLVFPLAATSPSPPTSGIPQIENKLYGFLCGRGWTAQG